MKRAAQIGPLMACEKFGAAPLSVNERQHKLLRLYATGERTSASWLDGGDHSLGPVADPYAPPPGAVQLHARRLIGDQEEGFKGQHADKCSILVDDFLALADCWTVPLQTLNARGLALADLNRDVVKPARTMKSFRLPDALIDRICSVAWRQRRDHTACAIEAFTEWVERNQ